VYNLLNNIRLREGSGENIGRWKTRMNIPSKRKLGTAAIIVAGLGAVLVPFMLHSLSPQGSSPSPTTTSGNNNNGNSGTKTTTTPGRGGSGGNTGTSKSGGTGGSSGSSTGGTTNGNGGRTDTGSNSTRSCSEDKSHDHDQHGHDSDAQANGGCVHNGNSYGVLKNQLDTTVAMVKGMGTHDPAYPPHHDTDADNDAMHFTRDTVHDPSDHDSSCPSGDQEHDHD
jgi:hypothetical protein